MRQRHALRCAFGAGGEQHDRRTVGLGHCGRGPGGQRGAEFIHRRRASPHVLEPDDARPRPDRLDFGSEIGLVDEGAGGQHEADERLFAGGGQIVRARGEVEHRRHAARGLQGKEGDRGAVGVGQQHADRLAWPRQGRDLPRQHADPDPKRSQRQRAAQRILDHRPRQTARLGRLFERREQRAANVEGHEQQVRHPIVKRQANRSPPCRAARSTGAASGRGGRIVTVTFG